MSDCPPDFLPSPPVDDPVVPRLIIDYHKDGVRLQWNTNYHNGTRSEVTLTDSNSLLSEIRNLICGTNVEILIIHNDPTE